MKFLLDANLPRAAVAVFSAHGEALHTYDLGLGGATDDKIFEAAVTRKAMLITRDLEFGNPHLFTLDRITGLVILRVPAFFTATQIVNVLREFLSRYPVERLSGHVSVVEPGRFRQRPLR